MEDNSNFGLLGGLCFAAPFVAGAIDDSLVTPTILIAFALIAAAYVIPRVPWGSLARMSVIPALILGGISIPVLTSMPLEQANAIVSCSMLLGGGWLVYKVGKSFLWG